MKAARAILLALLLGWVFPALTACRLWPTSRCRRWSGRVVDQTGTLSSGDVASLNQTLRNFEARKGSQIAVLIVPTTDGEAIEQFSLRVAETWKIGRKKIDDGALLVVAKNDRHLRIEVGYGLEGALTDVTSKRIIDEIITPKFKAGDFAGGISAGVNRIIRVIDGEKLPAPWSRSIGRLLEPRSTISIRSLPCSCCLVSARSCATCSVHCSARPSTGGVVGALAWYISGSFAAALLATVMVFMMALVAEILAAANQGRPRASRPKRMGRQQFVFRGLLEQRKQQRSSDSSSSSEVAAAAAVLAAAARREAGRLRDMGIGRIGKHLLQHHWWVRRYFPPNVLAAIEAATKAGEATHSGQVRFVVEGALDGRPLFRNQPARERALDIFSQLRIWDTAHNNGVLIYLLLADRKVEIIADRGIDAKVGAAGWEKICAEMETDFKAGNFERGVIKGIEAVSRELAKHFPPLCAASRTSCPTRRW